VVELLRAGQTADSSAISALFNSIDETPGSGSSHFETREAKLVATRVRDELGRKSKR
jgi:hypothetical protein